MIQKLESCVSTDHRMFMAMAIEAMARSAGPIKVGAVLVAKGDVVAVEAKGAKHAERAAIEQARAQGIDLRGSTLYTTLEPCVEGHAAQTTESCAALISSVGIGTVFIGRYDPNPLVNRRGWRCLRDSNIEVKDFPADLREEIDSINVRFCGFFSRGIGPRGGAKVDHKDQARFLVQFSADDERSMEIGWSVCGKGSAYAIARGGVDVTHARFARDFAEVDDPLAHESFKHFASLKLGEVGIFRNNEAFVLVKLRQVESGPDYGDANFFVVFDYDVRPRTVPG
jgi:diaminohydroxyphosphoribosylaminopyrimidine deaminase / 5-amino-6-(5-phosphoribosylamino)uracil reductase